MRFIKGLLVLVFAVSFFSSCMEEDYVKPSVEIENALSDDTRPDNPPRPGDN